METTEKLHFGNIFVDVELFRYCCLWNRANQLMFWLSVNEGQLCHCCNKKKKSGQCLVITSILEPALFSRICCLYGTIIINCAAIRETGICRFDFPLLPSHAHFSQRAPSIMPCKLSLFVFVFFGTGKLFASFALNLFVCFCAKGIWANYLSLLNLPVAWLW